MKKKAVKKLELSKETVIHLEAGNLQEIKGGLMVSWEIRCATNQTSCGTD